MLLLVAASGCSNRFGVPEPASRQGGEILDLWRVLFFSAVALGVLVIGLIGWSLVRYRRRTDGQAGGFSENVRLELFYTAVPLVIVAVLFGLTVATQRDVNRMAPQPDVRVEVTGFQWGWRFRYLTEGVVIVGTSTDNPIMVLPVDSTIRLNLLSPDVIHAFFVPEFLVKRDVIPGVDNRLDVTTTRTGRFGGVCAEFCGLDHARMTFAVEVVEPAQFQAWLREQVAQQRTTTSLQDGQGGGPGGQAAPPVRGAVRVG
ncbi:MAG: cytochrome c oxidase subunit II [Acidimicrobiales bacterium]